jgi:hypothetical protein
MLLLCEKLEDLGMAGFRLCVADEPVGLLPSPVRQVLFAIVDSALRVNFGSGRIAIAFKTARTH